MSLSRRLLPQRCALHGFESLWAFDSVPADVAQEGGGRTGGKVFSNLHETSDSLCQP